MMTDEQIKNWRNALYMTLGPYALIMPREEIEKLRGMMQGQLNDPVFIRQCEEENKKEEEKNKPCECDLKMYGYTKHEDGRVICNKCRRIRRSS